MALERDDILARLAEQKGSRADLSGLDLSGADLSRMDLRGTDLSRADLSAADLRWAVLEGADLHSSVLRRADVRWAVMRGANLRQADLGRANLGWSDLSGADLTGAELEGTSLESVDLSQTILDRGQVARPRLAPAAAGVPLGGSLGEGILLPPGAGLGAAPRPRLRVNLGRGLALPAVSARALALAFAGLMVTLHFLGWRYRSAYFFDGFGLGEQVPGLVTLSQSANLKAGLVEVLPLLLVTLLALPLFALGLGLVLGLLLLPVVVLWRFGERLLADIIRPRWRLPVIVGLFVAYTVFFILVLIPGALTVGRWALAEGLPGSGSLRSLVDLFATGGLATKAGLVAVLAGLLWPVGLGLRAGLLRLRHSDVPLAWRLRYPVLNSAALWLRSEPWLQRIQPVPASEARRASLTGLLLLLGLAALLAGAGKAQAQEDMCDGGDLQRVLLYKGDTQPKRDVRCQRLLAETDDHYYVFFPSQTQVGEVDRKGSRIANVREVEKEKDLHAELYSADGATECRTCGRGEGQGPDGEELAVIDPDYERTSGPIAQVAGQLIMLDLAPGDAVIDSVLVNDTTEILLDGGLATLDELTPGTMLTAFGRLDPTEPRKLLAAHVSVLTARAGAEGQKGGSIDVDLANPRQPVFSGAGWSDGQELEVRLVDIGLLKPGDTLGPDTEGHLLTEITVPPGGSFSAPVPLTSTAIPFGPRQRVLVVDPQTKAFTVTDEWLQAPLPEASATPTEIVFAPTQEPSATDDDGGEGEATETEAPPNATNTPLPTPNNLPPGQGPGGMGPSDCEADDFEPDNSRGREREIYPSLGGDGKTDSHNFCYKGDVDLASFQVKAGRWYRVFTKDPAEGVDTVLAVGDLPEGSVCITAHPDFGCWNDDKDDSVLASEVLFQAGGNGQVIVTVDNRGRRFGTEATYGLGAVQTAKLEPSATPSVAPSATPLPTRTRIALRDDFDNTAANGSCRYATVITWPVPWRDSDGDSTALEATIGSNSDEDWYQIELPPYVTAAGTAGIYRLELEPPEDHDYDMDAGIVATAGVCPNPVFGGHRDGDERERLDFVADVKKTIWVRIYGRPGAGEFDPFEYYELRLMYGPNQAPGVQPTATVRPSPTPAPPNTGVPPVPSASNTPVGRSLPTP